MLQKISVATDTHNIDNDTSSHLRFGNQYTPEIHNAKELVRQKQ
jgi:hypothetical protein